MSNLELYRKCLQLKAFLEIHELDNVSKAKLEKCVGLINQVFEVLERRKVRV